MPWYYAESGKQMGPFTDDAFQAFVNAGTIRPETLVWRDGMANWQPYQQIAPATPAPPPVQADPTATPAAVAGQVLCSECGQVFPPDQVIRIADKNVCAGCKPRLVQRLTEGAAASGFGNQAVNEHQLLEREYRVDIGSSLERAWALFSGNAGLVIGATLLSGLVFAGCHAVATGISLVVPFANVLLQALYIGPLTGGFIWFILKLARGEAASVGDAFAGFSRNFLQLFLASLVQTMLTFACFIPAGVIGLIGGLSFAARRGFRFSPGMGAGLIAAIAVTALVGFAAMIYITTLWTHSMALIVDKQMKFWPAMELSRKMVSKSWGMTFLFVLVGGIIGGAGAIACLVGLLVTGPLYIAMKVYFYDDNFRDFQPTVR